MILLTSFVISGYCEYSSVKTFSPIRSMADLAFAKQLESSSSTSSTGINLSSILSSRISSMSAFTSFSRASALSLFASFVVPPSSSPSPASLIRQSISAAKSHQPRLYCGAPRAVHVESVLSLMSNSLQTWLLRRKSRSSVDICKYCGITRRNLTVFSFPEFRSLGGSLTSEFCPFFCTFFEVLFFGLRC